MAVNIVRVNGNEILNLTDATAIASDILQGKAAYGANGALITGSLAAQQILCGTSAPSSSIGNNNDVYLLLSSSGTLETYPADYTASNMNSTSYAGRCIGVSAQDGSATNNMYSSGSSTTGVVEYSFDLSSIPSTATIGSVSCVVMAHEENSSRSTFTLQLYAGSTAKGSATTVSGTSNNTYTLNTGSWTRNELDSLLLHTEYGYYGGLVAGATLTIVYTLDNPSLDTNLTISESSWEISGSNIYKKTNSTWTNIASVTLDNNLYKA